MKQTIVLILLLAGVSINLYAQKEAVFCQGKGYRGYLFDSSYLILKSINQQHDRTTLCCDEIKTAEHILKKKLATLNTKRVNQTNDCPNICKNLSKYFRQYFGFINSKGEKIIWVNLFWDKESIDEAKRALIMVNDGCSYYWNIEVNITTHSLSNLQINGTG